MQQQLTKNFTVKEFTCKDGTVPTGAALRNIQELANNLQTLRDYLGKPITITSGFRSVKYNERVGGKKFSQHLIGKAADIRVAGMTPHELGQAITTLIAAGKMKQGGVGIYPNQNFVHYDIRGTRARW